MAPDRTITVLVETVEGHRLRFPNALDIAADGAIWFTDASQRVVQHHWVHEFWEGRATGRLLRYDPHTRQTSVRLDALRFTNGVALGPDDAFVLVNETVTARGTEGRIYPWGNKADPNRANYADTGLNRTSAVGCFPSGASPYGVEDTSGNVWEWTRSLEGNFPYPTDPRERTRREGLLANRTTVRMLRGGAFLSHRHLYVRCAFRDRHYPNGSGRSIGFRVVMYPDS